MLNTQTPSNTTENTEAMDAFYLCGDVLNMLKHVLPVYLCVHTGNMIHHKEKSTPTPEPSPPWPCAPLTLIIASISSH